MGVQACHSVCGGQRKSSYVGLCLPTCLRKGLCGSLQTRDFPESVSHFSLDMLELQIHYNALHYSLDMLELQIYYNAHHYMCSGDSITGPHTCTSRTLLTKISLLPNIWK